ncbi:MAG TPA: hypothetical protein PLN47_07655, partial [Candidatus Atribacteria bacterium]|nr:hypothetical protein [Candidatus Atribacteria bacterium]
ERRSPKPQAEGSNPAGRTKGAFRDILTVKKLLFTFLFLPGIVLSKEEDPVQLFQCILQLNQSYPVHRSTCDIDIQAKIKIPLLLPFTINLNRKLNLEDNYR